MLLTTFYVRDAAGSVMAVYNKDKYGTVKLTEHPIYGAGRLSVYYRPANTYAYQLADHLGNVRAVVVDAGGTAVSITNKADYYPFGMPMPKRHVDGGYRYAYQGQEKDDETGMEAFQLRLWDARIGRWLTVDPYRQFHSPYLGMGNNPINFIDPDGGMCTDGKGNVIPCPEGYGNFTGPTTETIVFNEGTIMAPDTYNALEAAVVTAPGATTQTLNIYRDIQTLNSTTSFFTFMDITGYMLEPAGPDTTTPNQDLRIPEGTYNIRSHNGNAFQNVFNLYNNEVAQHVSPP